MRLKGGMTLMNEDKKITYCIPIPTIEVLVGKKIRNQYDINRVDKIIRGWQDNVMVEFCDCEYFDFIFSIEYATDRRNIVRKLKSNKIVKEKTYFMFSTETNNIQILPYFMSKGLSARKLQQQLGILCV